jgi:Arc/MetJ family transcription regulator
LKLDPDLLNEAALYLGTKEPEETIEVALREVIDLQKRKRLAARRLTHLTPETLGDIRGPRAD